MAAVPIYVWNGTAWQETGPTIPASPIKYQASAPSSPSTGDIWVDSDGDVDSGSQQFQRFRFVASGGETTISGNDANGATLAYTAGLEQVVLNGAVLVRGHDYTATNGTSITGLSPALVANDVLEVFSFIAFTVANTYTQSQVDGLLADYVGLRLLVPGSATNGTVSTTGKVTFSAVSSISVNDVFSATYDNYLVLYVGTKSTGTTMNLRYRVSGADDSTSNYERQNLTANSTTISGQRALSANVHLLTNENESRDALELLFYKPFLTENTMVLAKQTAGTSSTTSGGNHGGSTSFTGFTLYPSSGTITGTIRVYGYKN
jgi:hypothetical protein